jgi:hypothetical protein
MDTQVEATFRNPNKYKKRTSPCYIIAKMPRMQKMKERSAKLLTNENLLE